MSELCKILINDGLQFVCMPDGRKLPTQTVSVVRQTLWERVVEVHCEALNLNNDYRTDGKKVFWGNDAIPGVSDFFFKKAAMQTDNETLFLSMKCVLGDTKENPI